MEHVFMNPLAIYAVVFNIVNLLNENTQQRVCNIDTSSYIIYIGEFITYTTPYRHSDAW